ncbi:YdcF family protein [Qipengyuania xiapuensis]|uniref:YdcF family protein n=1 Tax=Qipengyuania xiapuensis TaxID=2867236 RepID=A0ABX8ZU59_9SPHN|nr:YdcF family protein [Qipengyuania xiapuensis]QZD92439.1 YdcF family protein [Qipengyuania xiapuensis]
MKWLRRLGLALALWLVGISALIALGPADHPEQSVDVAIVLGAAVDDAEPSPVFAARLDHAIELYDSGRVERLLLTGARSAEDSLSEAEAGKRYAMARGVREEAILMEENSRTTFQNLTEARAVMEREEIGTAIIVSDPLHLWRAMRMADRLDMDASASAATETRYRSWSTQLPFLLRETYFVHHFWLFGE